MSTFIFAFIGQALTGWLLADFIGGIVHWWEDRIGWPTNRWIDEWVLEPNLLHHTDPVAFTETPFWMRNSTTMAAAISIGGLWWLVFGLSAVLAFAIAGGLVMNQVHYWQHKPAKGWIKVLQETGVIQGRKMHNRHHTPPYDGNYCVLTGWLNPFLEKLGFWTGLEKLLRITPRI